MPVSTGSTSDRILTTVTGQEVLDMAVLEVQLATWTCAMTRAS